MKKTVKNYDLLCALFCVCLVISNVMTGKIIDTGIPFMGSAITLPGAIVCYPITYLVTDIVGEIWGKREANHIVRLGLICQLTATGLIVLGRYLPYADPAMQEAYISLLGQNWIFVAGSLAAYLVSQSLDVTIFHKIRDKVVERTGDNRQRWIWNNASTMTSQLFDTAIFSVIAFGLGFGWLWNNQQALINMILGQYLVKLVFALCDTPFFYFFTRGEKREILKRG